MDDLRLVEAVDRFGEGVVVRVADAANGRLDPGFARRLSKAETLTAAAVESGIAVLVEARDIIHEF
jgi:hypothetical protein